jgi:RNA polymerase sigma-70 factor (ECF subfamily)
MDERNAITGLQQGDIDALEPLVRKYQQRAVRAAYLIIHDHAQAEDIVQHAFIRAFERIEQLRRERPFGPWFLQSVVNDALKAASRANRQFSLDKGQPAEWFALHAADPALGPEELIAGIETQEELWSALGALSAAQRSAIVLRYFLDLPESEAAERTGTRPGTHKWRLHAARLRLRQILGDAAAHDAASVPSEEPPTR